jgi:hypothetical protein
MLLLIFYFFKNKICCYINKTMMNQQQNNVPKKGDFVVNPNTSRPVKVGSRTWKNLVKEGLISGAYSDPKELAIIDENVNDQIEEVNKTLPRGQQAVRGRGKYKGKIVSRSKRADSEDIIKHTAKMASRIVNDNIEQLADCDDMEAELERMILEESVQMKKPKMVRQTTTKRKAKQEEQYKLEEPEEFYEESDDEDYFI